MPAGPDNLTLKELTQRPPELALGFDCATKTGWCLYDTRAGRVIESGVQDFSKKRGESNGLMFLRFRKWAKELCITSGAGIVGYEQAHFRGGAATEICVGLQTRCQEVAAELGIESAPVKTGELKKFATGAGNAGKEIMKKAAVGILGRQPIDDNEADAVHVARWVAAEFC